MNFRWRQLGGQAGIGIAIAGFILMFLGWNGAATYDRSPAQFPYLISGGLAGLGLVVIGGSLLVINAQRQDRAALLNSLAELREAVERLSLSAGAGPTSSNAAADAPGLVVAGPTTFHRPTCKLLDGRGALPVVRVEEAVQRGLTACRACDAGDLLLPESEPEPVGAGRRRRR